MLCGGLTTERVGPTFGGELTNESLGMRRDPQQDVLEVFERRDVYEGTALDERIEEGRATGPLEAAGK
jgi:hypothetical protein